VPLSDREKRALEVIRAAFPAAAMALMTKWLLERNFPELLNRPHS
jgi:hypothetical protein